VIFLLTNETVTATVARMLIERICPLAECGVKFQTDNPRKEFCCPQHSSIGRVRRVREKQRKKGGGGNGGGGGGGMSTEPTLFDTIVPRRDDAFVPLPVIGPSEPDRKPQHSVRATRTRGAAA